MIYGYCCTYGNRIVPAKKKILSLYPTAVLYWDTLKEPKLDFPERANLQKLLDVATKGDTIVIPSIMQLSSSSSGCYELYHRLFMADISLVFLNQPYFNTNIYTMPLGEVQLLEGLNFSTLQRLLIYANKLQGLLIEQQIEATYKQIEAQTSYSISKRPKKSKEPNIKVLEAKKTILGNSTTFGGKQKDDSLVYELKISQRTLTKYKHELKEELAESGIQASTLYSIYFEKICDFHRKHDQTEELDEPGKDQDISE